MDNINNYINEVKKEFNDFFKFDPGLIEVVEVNGREEIDRLKGYKTPDWLVGWVSENKVYVLSKESFEKDSSHKIEEFEIIIKHEIGHIYINKIVKSKKPIWVHEGVAGYLAKQMRNISYEDSFNAIDFFDKKGLEVYIYSSKFIEFLIDKFGKNKLLEFMKMIHKDIDEKEFQDNFKDIYGFKLNKEEIKLKARDKIKS